jgi:hypothetical protein
VSDQFLYHFPTEAAASESFGVLVRQLQEPVPEHGWVLAFEIKVIATGEIIAAHMRSPEDGSRELTLDRAMRRAWVMLCDARIEPPGMALGNLIGAVETQALLYVLTHNTLSPLYAEAAKIVLKALGVNAPDTIGAAVTGALGVLMDKITALEGIRVSIAVLTEVEKALADNKIEPGEILSVVTAAFKELTDGDSV